MVTEHSTLCLVPDCIDQRMPTTDYCRKHQRWTFEYAELSDEQARILNQHFEAKSNGASAD